MYTTTLVRALVIGAAGLICTTMSLPAKASLPGGGYIVYGSSGPDAYNSVPLGMTYDQGTCFLSGLGGNLSQGVYGAAPAGAWVSVDNDGNWNLIYTMGPSPVGYVGAQATCLWSTQNRLDGAPYHAIGSTEVDLGPATAERQCFLKGVSAWDGSLGNANFKATVEVAKNPSTGENDWYLETWNVSTNTSIAAICVDVPGASVYWENNWTGTYWVTAFTQTQSAPETCGLRGIAGAFSDPNGAGDGVWMNWPSSLPGEWNMLAADGKVGWLTCMQ